MSKNRLIFVLFLYIMKTILDITHMWTDKIKN
jgi:hypothetical protein